MASPDKAVLQLEMLEITEAIPGQRGTEDFGAPGWEEH